MILAGVLSMSLISAGLMPAAAEEAPPITVFISWDGAQGSLIDRLLAEEKMPNLQRLVDQGAHVRRTVGNWPSITPAGHAALWTGAYSSVNGISTMAPNVLTDEERAERGVDTEYGLVTEYGPSDFSAENLLVEPIWVTAARAGYTTTTVSVTHASPFEMYTTEDYVSSQGAQAFGDFSDELLLADPYRTASLQPRPVTAAVDGSGDVELTDTDASDWTNVPWGQDAAFREFTLGEAHADDAVLLHGLAVAPDGERFTHVVVSPERDYASGETLRATPFRNDTSQVSGPVRYSDCDPGLCVTGYAHLRLTDLADDGVSLTLWRTRLRDLSDYTTEPARIDEWIATGGAFTGNGPPLPPVDELPPLPSIYGELALQVNEYFFRNLVHEIEQDSADLYFSYSPYPDEWVHQLYAFTLQGSPVHTPEREALATSYIDTMMVNLDQHLGTVMDAVDSSDRDGNIVLSTDHGFEPTYYTFYPARALRDAGLTVTDSNGDVDPARTKVFYAGNGVLRVNLEDVYQGGIVRSDEYRRVVAETRQALEGVRGVDGAPIVRRVVESDNVQHEGLGGRHGGQLHLHLHPGRGYYWPADLGPEGAPVVEGNPVDAPYMTERHVGGGWHGNRVVGNEFEQGFAVLGGDQFADGRTFGQARSTDLAPTAAAAARIPPADHWTGRVLRQALAR